MTNQSVWYPIVVGLMVVLILRGVWWIQDWITSKADEERRRKFDKELRRGGGWS